MSDVVYPTVSSDWLKHESDPCIGRQAIKVVAGTGKLFSGTVLMAGANAGEYVACTALSPPTGVLIDGCDATNEDALAVQLISEAEIIHDRLSYAADVDTAAKQQAILDALEANQKIFTRIAV